MGLSSDDTKNNSGQVNSQHYMAASNKSYVKFSEDVNKARRIHTSFIFGVFICLFFGLGNPLFLVGTAALVLYMFLNKKARQRMYISMAASRLQASKINRAKNYFEKARNIADNELVQQLENTINNVESIGNNQVDYETEIVSNGEAELDINKDNAFNMQVERNLKGKKLEKQGGIESATSLYELNAKEGFPGTHPYDRLVTIYRRQKNYEDEIRIINRAIEVFSDLYSNCDIDIKKELYLKTVEKYKSRLEKTEELYNENNNQVR